MKQPKLYDVVFTYKPPIGGVEKVFIAGDFNNWDPTKHQLTEENGVYSLTLKLRKGQYQYKLVVDGRWQADETAHNFFGDGYGEQNSVVNVGQDISRLYEVVFTFSTPDNCCGANLAGSFNRWDTKADQMEPTGTPRQYSLTAYLRAGEYHYKFVADDGTWYTDQNAEDFVDDGLGGKEAVIYVDDRYPALSPERGDGRILFYGIAKRQDAHQVNPISMQEVELKTRSYRNDVERVWLVTPTRNLPMECFAGDELYDFWHVYINLDPGKPLRYCFLYEDGPTKRYLLPGKTASSWQPDELFLFDIDQARVFFTPDWVKDGVFYQIFPDRFCNGDASLNQDFSEDLYNPERGVSWLSPAVLQHKYTFEPDWDNLDPLANGNDAGHYVFYGGDIPGVQKKLDYLADLGITIIYFNPLNMAESNHRYDASSYLDVDLHLGGNKVFAQFVQECHSRGIRVIVDFAFNHVGINFFAFKDAALKGPSSRYWHWFEFYKWPLPKPIPAGQKPLDYYQCWWGFPTLPDLDWDKSRPHPVENTIVNINQAQVNWDVVDHVNEVARHWLVDFDIDGFRLDVPNEVPFWFWQDFAYKVRKIKPDAYLVGEIWTDAERWVNSRYFDAVMNYIYFRDPAMRFFAQQLTNAPEFVQELSKGLISYPSQASQVMMNLLDSHDTHRFLEVCQQDINRHKLAVLFQMTYVGAPQVYYGDEIAIAGGRDPDNRRPFNWNWQQNPVSVDLHSHYKTLITLRKKLPALRRGNFAPVLAQGKTLAYWRRWKEDSVLVAINNSNQPQSLELAAPAGNYLNHLTGQTIKAGNWLKINLPAMAGAVLSCQHEH